MLLPVGLLIGEYFGLLPLFPSVTERDRERKERQIDEGRHTERN